MTEAEAAVDALTALLRDEIAALESGAFEKVSELAEEKARLGAVLAAAEEDAAGLLPEKLTTLRDLIAKDEALLTRVAATASEIAAEIARIRDRHTLRGLYGKTGEKQGRTSTGTVQFDRSL